MKNLMKHSHFVSVSALLLSFTQPDLQAAASPSFNCQKAASVVERAICSDEILADLDQQLGKIWKSFLSAFNDADMKAQMRQEQSAWVTSRNQCQADINCISTAYKQRLNALGFEQHNHPLAGQYANEAIGSVTVYPAKDGGFLVAIQTADPNQGTWTCEVYGKAVGNQNSLSITVDSNHFSATISDAGILTIEANDDVFSVAQSHCGLNGGFSDSYRRVSTR